ncbi:MAG: TonB family protein [Burkholderiales bacterium]|nr:TonB family protein [Burkholderiales bacterium]
MHSVEAAVVTLNGATGWSKPAVSSSHSFRSRSVAQLVAVAALHGGVLWLVLSGAQRIAPHVPSPPIIAHILRPPNERPPRHQESPKPPPLAPRVTARVIALEPAITDSDATSPAVTEAPPSEPAPPASAARQDTGHSPAPAAAEPRGFGSIVNRAACLAAFRDSYPRDARRSRQEGSVTIAARISADGRVLHAEVVNAQPRRMFDRAALNVLNAGACRFDSDIAGYAWQAEISYRLDGESTE